MKTASFVQLPSIARCRGWQQWPGFHNRKGNHSWFSSVRSVQPAKTSGEVVYRKLILWSVLVFLSIGWIVFYINTGIASKKSDFAKRTHRSLGGPVEHPNPANSLLPTETRA